VGETVTTTCTSPTVPKCGDVTFNYDQDSFVINGETFERRPAGTRFITDAAK
jgi:hypothetical protein